MIQCRLEIRRGAFRLDAGFRTEARAGGLFGPSGSGKSTILMAVAGLVTPDRGRIQAGDTVLFDSATGVNLPPDRRRVGVVFQDGRLFPHLSVRENLLFPRAAGFSVPARFEEIVHLLDLEPLLSRGVHEVSGGQGRLVAVARALLSNPRLLLLDEPLTGLDPGLRRRVLAYLVRLKHSIEIDMLYVSHVFSDLLALADEASLLREGRILARGSPVELMSRALGEAEAGAVETLLEGTVTGGDAGRVVVHCSGADLRLSVPGARKGDPVYVTVGAEDVVIGVGSPPTTSARNVLPGRISGHREHGATVLVAVDAGPRIWAEVTRESRDRLDLETGREVYLLVKSSALRGVVLR